MPPVIRKTFCLASLLLMAGCTPYQLYSPPAQGPRAQIKSELYTPNSYNNLLAVGLSTDTGCRLGRQAGRGKESQLFSVYNATPRPAGYQAIAADTPLHLVMQGTASAGRGCVIEFITSFAADGHYLLKGGIIDHDELCRIDVVNADTGVSLARFETPTQVPPAASEPYARRQLMDQQGCYLPTTDKDRQP